MGLIHSGAFSRDTGLTAPQVAAQAWQKGKVGCYEFQASLGYKKRPYLKTTGNRSQQPYKASSNLPQSIW